MYLGKCGLLFTLPLFRFSFLDKFQCDLVTQFLDPMYTMIFRPEEMFARVGVKVPRAILSVVLLDFCYIVRFWMLVDKVLFFRCIVLENFVVFTY